MNNLKKSKITIILI